MYENRPRFSTPPSSPAPTVTCLSSSLLLYVHHLSSQPLWHHKRPCCSGLLAYGVVPPWPQQKLSDDPSWGFLRLRLVLGYRQATPCTSSRATTSSRLRVQGWVSQHLPVQRDHPRHTVTHMQRHICVKLALMPLLKPHGTSRPLWGITYPFGISVSQILCHTELKWQHSQVRTPAGQDIDPVKWHYSARNTKAMPLHSPPLWVWGLVKYFPEGKYTFHLWTPIFIYRGEVAVQCFWFSNFQLKFSTICCIKNLNIG